MITVQRRVVITWAAIGAGASSGCALFLSFGLIGGGDGTYLPFCLIGSPVFFPIFIPAVWAAMAGAAVASASKKRRLLIGGFLLAHYAAFFLLFFSGFVPSGKSIAWVVRVAPGTSLLFLVLYLASISPLWWAILSPEKFHPVRLFSNYGSLDGA